MEKNSTGWNERKYKEGDEKIRRKKEFEVKGTDDRTSDRMLKHYDRRQDRRERKMYKRKVRSLKQRNEKVRGRDKKTAKIRKGTGYWERKGREMKRKDTFK